MARFVLIDHSIKRLGGHNLEYALQALAGAAQAGYEPVLAVNSRFFEQARVPSGVLVMPLYQHTTYEVPKWRSRQAKLDPRGEFSASADAYSLSQASLSQRLWQGFTRPWRRMRHQHYATLQAKFVERFADDTAWLLELLKPRPDDQFLVATMMESELAGLLRLFSAQPRAAELTWNLQFHFRLFTGREPDYAAQAAAPAIAPLRELFAQAELFPAAKLNCFCTTERLAEQYRRITRQPFQVLPWPVSTALTEPRPPRHPERPLRVGVPGCVRAEKGTAQLTNVVTALADEFLHSRRLQLLVQTQRIGKLSAPLRRVARLVRDPSAAAECAAPVTAVRWPLATADYQDLVRMTDIGLLLYDSAEYYARLSSILVEFLAAGIPVIVPAACWLAEQLAEPIWAHQERLLCELPALAELPSARWEWNTVSPSSHGQHSIDDANGIAQRRLAYRQPLKLRQDERDNDQILINGAAAGSSTAVVTIPTRATHLALRFAWREPTAAGTFLEFRAAVRNRHGMEIQQWREITGRRAARPGGSPREQSLFMPLPADATVVEMSLKNAYGAETITLEHAGCRFWDAFVAPGGCALGAAGLIAADAAMAPQLLSEMSNHYAHYRASAERNAAAWRETTDPRRVIEQLRTIQVKPGHAQSRAA